MEDSKRLCIYNLDQAMVRIENAGSLGSDRKPDAAATQSAESTAADGDGGTVEQMIGVFDLRDFSINRNADLQFIAFMVSQS